MVAKDHKDKPVSAQMKAYLPRVAKKKERKLQKKLKTEAS